MPHKKFAPPALALVLLALFGCSEGEEIQREVDLSGRPVKTIEIMGGIAATSNRYPAVIDATTSRDLSFAVSGVISELPVNESTEVAQGDLIARLDQQDLQSSVNSARASYENAESEYQRAVRLAAQDAIAKSVLEQRKAQRDLSKAQLDTADKALADSVIYAPFAGVVADVPASISSTVTRGSTIATLISTDTMDAIINLPASVISGVQTRQDLGASVILDSAPDEEIAAEFREATLIADTASQTYSVTLKFNPPEKLLVLPGMNATVVLRSQALDAADRSLTSLPLSAIQSDGDGEFVWIVTGSPLTVTRRSIVIAPGVGENVLVSEGLEPGDRVVGAGGAYLSEGLVVTEWAE